MSRDIVRQLIEWGKFDVKIHSINWGDTPMTALDENNPKDKIILDCIVPEKFEQQPELYVSISIPTEFRKMGKYNIGITAGIETSVASPQWVSACNVMDLVLVISNHAKNVFQYSKWKEQTPDGTRPVEVQVPIEVVPNCIDTYVYKKPSTNLELEPAIRAAMEVVTEKFNFLFVGHWLHGELGEDRKNVAFLIKLFLSVFKQTIFPEKPGLILKTSGAGYSIMDYDEMVRKIEQVRNSVELLDGESFPNIYLLHGDLTDSEMNSLYNHTQVKVHISLTKGEGFGRPLLEASLSGKPVIASGWSGQLDFLNPEDAILVAGELKPVHQSSLWNDIIIKEATWFYPDINHAANAMVAVMQNYDEFRKKARKLAAENKEKFNYRTVQNVFWNILNKYVPEFKAAPKLIEFKLPELKTVSKKFVQEGVSHSDPVTEDVQGTMQDIESAGGLGSNASTEDTLRNDGLSAELSE